MPEFPLEDRVLRSAIRCRNSLSCVKHGPSCEVGTFMAPYALLVHCQGSSSCPYRSGMYVSLDADRSMCTCPVRIALYEKYRV